MCLGAHGKVDDSDWKRHDMTSPRLCIKISKRILVCWICKRIWWGPYLHLADSGSCSARVHRRRTSASASHLSLLKSLQAQSLLRGYSISIIMIIITITIACEAVAQITHVPVSSWKGSVMLEQKRQRVRPPSHSWRDLTTFTLYRQSLKSLCDITDLIPESCKASYRQPLWTFSATTRSGAQSPVALGLVKTAGSTLLLVPYALKGVFQSLNRLKRPVKIGLGQFVTILEISMKILATRIQMYASPCTVLW